MVAPRYRSRSMRRVKVKTPGGNTVIHYEPRAHAKAQCGRCKAPLQAVMTARPSILGKFAKTERRPERPYGGVLCSKCLRLTIKDKARGIKA